MNFRLAANELNLTQGAVAQSVRALEADLGVSLFVRKARGLAFTETGERFYSEISRGLALIEEATRKIHPDTGTVTISVPPSFASRWLVPRLPGFMEAHPGIDVRIMASEQVTDFRSLDVDIAVRQGNRPADQKLTVQKIAPLCLGAYCSPGAGFFPGLSVNFHDLSGLPLIQDSHMHWQRLFGDRGLSFSGPSLQFNHTSLALDAAANRQGIAIAPDLIAMADVTAGRLSEIWSEGEAGNLGFWLIHPLTSVVNQTARSALTDWILSECK